MFKFTDKNGRQYRLRKPVKIALFVLLLIILACIFFGLSYLTPAEETGPSYGDIKEVSTTDTQQQQGTDYDMKSEPFVVKVFNVGQGNATLIDYGDTEVLIDGGYYNEKNIETLLESKHGLSEYVKDGKIEYIISTHSDADHIGCLASVIDKYDVGKIIYGDLLGDNESIRYFTEAAKAKNCELIEDYDTVLSLGKNATITIYDVCDGDKEDVNNNSVVTLIQYGETYFFTSGDLPAEKEVLLRGKLPQCDVVIAGHHGSSDSNSLLDELKPTYFVVSCGKAVKEGTKQGNTYGHPHKEVLEKAIALNADCYGTWKSGNIVFKSDGMSVSCSAKYEDQLTVEDAGAK